MRLTLAPFFLAALAFAGSGPAMAGCVATAPDRPARGGPPPAPLSEIRSAPPAPGMVWIAGDWHYNGVDYVWVPGRWESPPPAP